MNANRVLFVLWEGSLKKTIIDTEIADGEYDSILKACDKNLYIEIDANTTALHGDLDSYHKLLNKSRGKRYGNIIDVSLPSVIKNHHRLIYNIMIDFDVDGICVNKNYSFIGNIFNYNFSDEYFLKFVDKFTKNKYIKISSNNIYIDYNDIKYFKNSNDPTATKIYKMVENHKSYLYDREIILKNKYDIEIDYDYGSAFKDNNKSIKITITYGYNLRSVANAIIDHIAHNDNIKSDYKLEYSLVLIGSISDIVESLKCLNDKNIIAFDILNKLNKNNKGE